MHIKTNDTVEVKTGDDKGQRGKVLSIDRRIGRLVVEGVNRVYKHVRRSQKNPQGGRLSKEMPLQISNVLLLCSRCGSILWWGRCSPIATRSWGGSAREGWGRCTRRGTP